MRYLISFLAAIFFHAVLFNLKMEVSPKTQHNPVLKTLTFELVERGKEVGLQAETPTQEEIPAPLGPPKVEQRKREPKRAAVVPRAKVERVESPTMSETASEPQGEEERGSKKEGVEGDTNGKGLENITFASSSEAGQLTKVYTPPSYYLNPEPSYPEIARKRGIEGKVILEVVVAPDGTPKRVDLKESSGSKVLDRAALEGVGRWKFLPAQEDGRPVEGLVEIPIVFRLR